MKSSNALALLLLRHEETESLPGVLYSQIDVPLSARGRRRTEKLVERLSCWPIKAVYGSDLSRSRYGAELLAQKTGAPLRLTPLLREIDFGEWTGLTFEELLEIPAFRERLRSPERIRPPGGESLAELAQRALKVIEEIRQDFQKGLVVIFGHGGLNRALVSALIDIPLSRFFSLEQRPGAMNLLVFFPDTSPILALFNASPELDLTPYFDYYGIGGKNRRQS